MRKGDRHRQVLALRNIGVSYRRRVGILRWEKYWALKDISLDLYHGETLGIIGRNGAGKSTLLRVLSGIIQPDYGQITSDCANASLLSLQVGFIPHLSGRENAILSGMMMGLHRREIEQKIDAICHFSELGSFFGEPVRSYSVGMRARLGFSIAFQVNPEVLLIDEILGVGDAEFKKKSTAAMRERIRSDKTVVLVSHTTQTIQDLCDRVVWIENGVIKQVGGTDSTLDAYLKITA